MAEVRAGRIGGREIRALIELLNELADLGDEMRDVMRPGNVWQTEDGRLEDRTEKELSRIGKEYVETVKDAKYWMRLLNKELNMMLGFGMKAKRGQRPWK